MSRRRTAALVAALAMPLSLLVATGASADTLTVPDRANGQGQDSDIRRIRVVHRAADTPSEGRLKVFVRAGTVEYGDTFDLWVDVPGAQRVPDYHAWILPEAGYGPVRHARSWTRDGRPACQRWNASLSAGPDQTAVFSIPRTCLGSPERVRVAVRADYGDGNLDWVPARRTLTDWVAD